MSALAPTSIFRAGAIAAKGLPWVEDGFHIRVNLSPWIGFPLHPFAAWRIADLTRSHEPSVIWRGADGRQLSAPFDLSDARGEAIGIVLGAGGDDPCIWVEPEIEAGDELRVDLLDTRRSPGGAPRVLATRREPPFRFGGAEVAHVRVSGRGVVHGLRSMNFSSLSVAERIDRPPDLTFGLPLDRGAWYAPGPGDPHEAAAERVRSAAPRLLSPPDNLTPAEPGTDPSDEAARILEAIAPKLVDPWLLEGFGEGQVAPVDRLYADAVQTQAGSRLAASAPVTASLLAMGVDPQIARYLGLARMISFDDTEQVEPASAWVVASRWAVQPKRQVLRIGEDSAAMALGPFLASAASVPRSIVDLLDGAFPDATELIASELPQVRDPDTGEPWSAATLLTVAVAAGEAPPDAPDPFKLSLAGHGSWNPRSDPAVPEPERWRQSISLGDQAARGMVGFARMSPGKPLAVQRSEPNPDTGLVSRVLPLVPNWASNNRRLVTDRTVPPDEDGASWRVWQADEFGRWSEGADVSATQPARPAPPPPVAEATYAALGDDGSTGPRVPGEVHLRCVVPADGAGAPGSLPISELIVSVDGEALAPIAAVPGEIVLCNAEPGVFAVGEQRSVSVTAAYSDTAGNVSSPETLAVKAFDARSPQAVATSPVLLWTGAPDATGQTELALRWPPQAGAASYRVYLGDAQRLAGTLAIGLPPGSLRSAQVKPIHDASARLTDKRGFTLIGQASGAAGDDGFVHFQARIPGSLRTVQFVRIVPLSAGGGETRFEACGLVPIAVPGCDRPPTPALSSELDPAVGLMLRIRGQGLHKDLLDAAPGELPEFRLRRTRTSAADRALAPVWKSGTLSTSGADGWEASVTVPVAELEPFVKVVWFAEVRYPAEPAVPPGVAAVPVDGAAEPAWSAVGSAAEAIWSDLSLAAESLLIPPSFPLAPAAPTLAREPDGTNVLELAGLPLAHPSAIAPYRLEIYRADAVAAFALAASEDLLSAELTWSDPTPATSGTRYSVLVVDPIGRRSPATTVANPI